MEAGCGVVDQGCTCLAPHSRAWDKEGISGMLNLKIDASDDIFISRQCSVTKTSATASGMCYSRI